MKIDFKITINTQSPDSEVEEMLKETGKKIGQYRKLLESEKVSFKKEDKEQNKESESTDK